MRRIGEVLGALALLLVFIAQGQPQAAVSIVVPAGFHVGVFAQGLSDPTAMAFGPDRRLYIAGEEGTVQVMSNSGLLPVASGFATILGLAWHSHKMYVSSTGMVSTLTPNGDYTRWSRKNIVTGLPTGRHQNDGMAFRGQWMYLGVGSTCDACSETNPHSATMMRFHDNGTRSQVYAHGLRNPYGLAIRKADGQLYATDNGRDHLGDKVPDELNRIKPGKWYGWPGCYGNHKGTHCAGTVAPVAELPSHCSADGLVFFNTSGFGSYYKGGAFIAEYGDTIDTRDTGHVVQFVHFGAHGRTVINFARGFEHPLAETISPDHSLLVADLGTGIIWRIWK